jgi:F-type H+-transporting ATPase subunit epsilon
MATLQFELVTPVKLVRSGPVHMVVVPGTEGNFGVLAGHAPLVSTLRPGEIHVYPAPGTEFERIPVEGGLAEVNAVGLTILTGDIESVNQ